MLERLHVTMHAETMNGVRVFVLTPDDIPPEHRDKVLIHIHGGCYELYPGESGTGEAIIMAGLGHYKVISVDYRMPPEAYFPAALDDVDTVYKDVLKTTDSKNVAVFGTSAGGALVLETMLRAKQGRGCECRGRSRPVRRCPMSRRRATRSTRMRRWTTSWCRPNGFCHAATVVYAHGHDLKDPLLSPVYGDMHDFPPTILTTGTRDLLLSNTSVARHGAGACAHGGVAMNCNQVQARLSDYLDGAVSGLEMVEMGRHIDGHEDLAGCSLCSGELAAWRTTQGALAAARQLKAPDDLALKLRLAISHEKARRDSRLLDRISLAWENGVRPALLQVSAGVAGSVVLLGTILVLMNMVGAAPAVEADDEPLGAVTQPHYLYSTIGSDTVVTPTDSPIVVEASVDAKGRVYDYTIVEGPEDKAVRTQVVNHLLDSVFQPASAFGVPIRGRVVLTYSGILVRG